MMRAAALVGLLFVLLLSGHASGEDADVSAARASVPAQLDAFRAGDFDRAYTYASATIREQFGRAAFERMVRLGYPQIAAPASFTVDGAERAPDGTIYLFLRIRGRDGSGVEAVYEMVSEDGAWKINGVVTRPESSRSARARAAQNRPTMFPSASTSIVSAPGALGSPGMVRMSPA
jgi:hypothetical protein